MAAIELTKTDERIMAHLDAASAFEVERDFDGVLSDVIVTAELRRDPERTLLVVHRVDERGVPRTRVYVSADILARVQFEVTLDEDVPERVVAALLDAIIAEVA